MHNIINRSLAYKTFSALLLISAVTLSGCDNKDKNPPPPPEKPITEKSVVFNDPGKLLVPFSFKKTMEQIAATSGGISTTSESMLQSMIDSFAENSFIHPVSGKSIEVTSRPLESKLNPKDLLDPKSPDGMIPVGLFNRFDLAPADGSNCGEYRIVYAKNSSNFDDRLLMIFEARVPNPNPNEGLVGCAPITDFWAKRSNDIDAAQTVSELEKFYYQGIPGVKPVVNAKNYGMPLGQLRVNLFKTPEPGKIPWSLREFLVGFDQHGQANFKPEPVDDSPVSALFRAIMELPPGFDEADQNDFRQSFLGQSLCNLVNPDRIDAKASPSDIINGISAGYDPRFNDFESISQGNVDDLAHNTDVKLLEQVQNRLAALTDLSGVSSVQLINRAGTMTCGGCHDFSAGKELGNGATWPGKTLSFVHIDENGKLSPLLTDFFIPKRVQIAQHFKEKRESFHQTKAACPGVTSDSTEAATPKLKQARGLDVYEQVDNVRSQVEEIIQAPAEQAEKSEKLKALLPELQQAIDSARKTERASEGAYTPARTH